MEFAKELAMSNTRCCWEAVRVGIRSTKVLQIPGVMSRDFEEEERWGMIGVCVRLERFFVIKLCVKGG